MFAPIRLEYTRGTLERGDLNPDPIEQFRLWFDVAMAAAVPEPDAMCLSTATQDGMPSARMVLLRGFDSRGFCLFSNYLSRKGRELEANPHAALTFFWQPLERQVRIEGNVERTSVEESDAYFHSRPINSRVGACVSRQSETLRNRAELDEAIARLAREGEPPTRPGHWGGYRVVPNAIEFWQGRANRLHDRFRYRRSGTRWVIDRLAP